MTVLPICITGEPVLHRRPADVTDFGPEFQALVDDMIETMHAAPGVGLAAPQVGVGLRLFVYHWEDADDVLHEGVAANPELWISPPAPGEADEDDDSEGCLSVPGERFPVVRAESAILKAFNRDGEPFTVEARGWLARIFQHEYDHLDGVLYVDRLQHPWSKAATKAIRKNSWGAPGQTWMPGVDDLEG